MDKTIVHHVRRYIYKYTHNHLNNLIEEVYIRSLSRAQEKARIFFNDNKKGVSRKEHISKDYWGIWSYDDIIEVRKYPVL